MPRGGAVVLLAGQPAAGVGQQPVGSTPQRSVSGLRRRASKSRTAAVCPLNWLSGSGRLRETKARPQVEVIAVIRTEAHAHVDQVGVPWASLLLPSCLAS